MTRRINYFFRKIQQTFVCLISATDALDSWIFTEDRNSITEFFETWNFAKFQQEHLTLGSLDSQEARLIIHSDLDLVVKNFMTDCNRPFKRDGSGRVWIGVRNSNLESVMLNKSRQCSSGWAAVEQQCWCSSIQAVDVVCNEERRYKTTSWFERKPELEQ